MSRRKLNNKIVGAGKAAVQRIEGVPDNGLQPGQFLPIQGALRDRIAEDVENAVVELALEEPAWGQVRVANELKKQGLMISPAGARCVWLRHDLENIKKRLKALEAKSQRDGMILTEAQVAALEKAKREKESQGEFESECPGYCGAQDMFYVGTLKGVGRIYQQTFIDTYSKVAFAKLYDRKTPIAAAELLNDRVVPFLRSMSWCYREC